MPKRSIQRPGAHSPSEFLRVQPTPLPFWCLLRHRWLHTERCGMFYCYQFCSYCQARQIRRVRFVLGDGCPGPPDYRWAVQEEPPSRAEEASIGWKTRDYDWDAAPVLGDDAWDAYSARRLREAYTPDPPADEEDQEGLLCENCGSARLRRMGQALDCLEPDCGWGKQQYFLEGSAQIPKPTPRRDKLEENGQSS